MSERRESRDRNGGGERRERREGPAAPKGKVGKTSAAGKPYFDYKESETLRRLTAANGKIFGRRRTGASALEQRMLSQAVKRARFMALIPYQQTTQ